jgi:hypothetical protein
LKVPAQALAAEVSNTQNGPHFNNRYVTLATVAAPVMLCLVDVRHNGSVVTVAYRDDVAHSFVSWVHTAHIAFGTIRPLGYASLTRVLACSGQRELL